MQCFELVSTATHSRGDMGTEQVTIKQPLFQFYKKRFLLIFLSLYGFKSSALKIDPKFWKPAGSGPLKNLELYFKSVALSEWPK